MPNVSNELLEKFAVVAHRLLRKPWARALWFILVIGVAVFQALMFLRQRSQGVEFFHSTYEAVLVAALVVVLLLGVFVKGQSLRK